MSVNEPEAANSSPSEQTDWNSLMADYDWRMNIVSDPDDPNYMQGLDMVTTLRRQYGEDNVIVNMGAKDVDQEALTRIRGKLGVHVRKGAVRLED